MSYSWTDKARIFRDRFHGRADVFGKQWQTQREDGTIAKGYTPECENIWTDKCHIKLKDGINCSDCEVQKFASVTDESVLRHIKGEEFQMHYMLQPDGTIKFGAFDFDYKPGKEQFGHTFKDVKRATAVLKEWGMPYALARSTGNGYHIYFFMEDFYPARKFRSIIWEVMDRCGFMTEHLSGIRPFPEVFPKQSYISETGLGNGIKPPMIEANFHKGRNCLVDDDDNVIPSENQWSALESIPKIKTKFMDDLIEKLQIILEPEHNVALSGRGATRNKTASGPVNGSIEKVTEGCSALRNIRDKMRSNNYCPSHFEGTALWHLSMNTLDGKEWFINNVPGWGKDSSGLKQLQHSVNKGYSPWTCRKMQESGVCPLGTKCFEKKPPVEYIEGRPVVKTDAPESEWPEPSPIRYAFGKGEDFLKKLMEELSDISKISDPEQKQIQTSAIIARASVFDDTQQTILKTHIETLKISKKSDINKMFTRANSERQEKVSTAATSSSEYFTVAGVNYKFLDYGYSMITPSGKRGAPPTEKILTNCFIDILEERTVIDDNRVNKKKIMFGRFTGPYMITDFEIDADSWADNQESFKFFIRLCGISTQFKRTDMDVIRQIVHYTSENGRHGVAPAKKTVYYSAPGWYDGTYITPTVIVDKNGVRPNTEKPVDNSSKEHSGNIDFKLLNDPEVLETMFHLKTDFMSAFNRDHAMICLGFTMMASVHSYLKISWKPTLWLEGLTGSGKTGLVVALQNFYGDFKGGVNWKTTGNSMLEYAYQFKDVMMLVDDFKDRNLQEKAACSDIIQGSYDYSVRGALKKDGEQRGDKYSRGLFLMTGEEVPQGHASVFARMLILECPKVDMTKTSPQFEKVREYTPNYKGITPRFIHWVLNQDKSAIQKILNDHRDVLQLPIKEQQNASRISFNIALAFTGWSLFCDFMRDYGAMTQQEVDHAKAECWSYSEHLRSRMVVRCTEEQSGNLLISRLAELLASGKARIQHLSGYDNDRAEKIGFVDSKDKNPCIAYLYPDTTIKIVKEHITTPLIISRNSAGAQLKELSVLVKTDIAHGKTTITKKENGANVRVWAVDLSKFGIYPRPSIVSNSRIDEEQPMPDAEGLI